MHFDYEEFCKITLNLKLNMSIKELTKGGDYFYWNCSALILHVLVRHYNLPDDKDTIYGRNMRDDHANPDEENSVDLSLKLKK